MLAFADVSGFFKFCESFSIALQRRDAQHDSFNSIVSWSSFLELLLRTLFVIMHRCKLFPRISYFSRNYTTGLLSTTTIP